MQGMQNQETLRSLTRYKNEIEWYLKDLVFIEAVLKKVIYSIKSIIWILLLDNTGISAEEIE